MVLWSCIAFVVNRDVLARPKIDPGDFLCNAFRIDQLLLQTTSTLTNAHGMVGTSLAACHLLGLRCEVSVLLTGRRGDGFPDGVHQLVDFRFRLFQFGTVERKEVVDTEVTFGHFREKFHLVGERVVSDSSAVAMECFVTVAALFVLLVCLKDTGFLEAENLIVIGVGEFVEDDPGLFADISRRGYIGGSWQMNAFGQLRGVTVGFEPADAGMILHGAELAVVQVENDTHRLQFFETIFGNHGFDVCELSFQESQGPLAQFVMRGLEEPIVHEDRPAFEAAACAGSGPVRLVRLCRVRVARCLGLPAPIVPRQRGERGQKREARLAFRTFDGIACGWRQGLAIGKGSLLLR